MRLALVLAAVVSVAVSSADAQEKDGEPAKPDLKPGSRMILKFPELPRTLYAMVHGEETAPQICVSLPENYSPDRKFPLFAFIWGGDGGDCTGAGRGPAVMSKKDCIFVNLPLFKKTWNPDGPFEGRLVDLKEDAEVICSSYAAMMKKLYEVIPNIDTANNII
ncbi:MAG: hypothetical protein IT452_02955, partial [Planctomycetia bacterium]|nr:hypothetical protein [Planctomycetia bacterium]